MSNGLNLSRHGTKVDYKLSSLKTEYTIKLYPYNIIYKQRFRVI